MKELGDALPDEFSGEIVYSGTHPLGTGTHVVVRYPNGYGASIVQNPYSYGVELAVLVFDSSDDDYDIVYDTPVTDDVIGYLNRETLTEVLAKIKALPPRQQALDSGGIGELKSL
ncbi:hypothetical protein QEH42_gp119 [Microbacterium phage Pumpernickel]|uniref:Uncharacterized protein n=1 Tax=Microbacterium phage Pumpernickel TaxID=2885983 RepID=A0AAE8YBD2_9CAUD|nr:hypothetical protein QEH42_gp048 [Microbacterium phage Pumpernickel]YP_010755339.1 hypothetical protein QEH42_gp119 [Microbacterium phage Pumpernickel]UDL15839.1 hypothetical protein SEA_PUMPERNICKEL_48 [Microbacterium phage Pumpernickel]UDL16099.1 hypothetical protein SEA_PUMPERNICKEL_349 [Microbacterium phage Pumpernickel]